MNFTKENQEILWTKDYDDFTFYKKNRPVDMNYCEKKIKKSLLENGWLISNPMIVDGKLRIRDGQHRFVVAKKLGIDIPVLIVENFNDDKMFSLNNALKKWSRKDFIHYYAQNGDKNAKIIYDLMEQYDISVRLIETIVQQSFACVITQHLPIMDVSKDELIKKINMINEITNLVKMNFDKFRCSLAVLMRNPQYNHKTMLQKLSYQLDRVHSCNTIHGYILMLQDIYNYNSHSKVIFVER